MKYKSSTQPKSVANLLDGLLKRRHLHKKVEAYSFFTNWEAIAGERFAAVSQPERIIRGSVLVVRVIDSAWIQELMLHKQSLLNELQKQNRGAHIEDIRFTAGNPKSFRKNTTR